MQKSAFSWPYHWLRLYSRNSEFRHFNTRQQEYEVNSDAPLIYNTKADETRMTTLARSKCVLGVFYFEGCQLKQIDRLEI